MLGSWKMNHRNAPNSVGLGFAVAPAGSALIAIIALASACSPASYVADREAEAMLREIEALTADRSSTSDSECGIATMRGCIESQFVLVYSRATVDEGMLLEKVEQYNELRAFANQLNPYCDFEPGAVGQEIEARSVNGVCVAVYP
jgi:hypothetical protein